MCVYNRHWLLGAEKMTEPRVTTSGYILESE